MRRVFSLAILALALPTSASAQGVGKVFELGPLQSGTITGSLTEGASFDISVVGRDSFFFFDIGTLTQFHQGCDPDFGLKACFTFSTGTITVKNTAGATVFTASLHDGQVLERTNTPLTWILTYSVTPKNPLLVGAGGQLQFSFTGKKVTRGEGRVQCP